MAAPRAKPKAATTRVTARRAKPASTSRTTAKPKPSPAAAAAPKPAVTPGPPSQTGNSQTGKASWYNAPAGTCAHRTLPKGLVVTVTNVGNGKQVTCRVADRGPYIDGRIIDLSRSGFEAIAPVSAGVVSVRVDW